MKERWRENKRDEGKSHENGMEFDVNGRHIYSFWILLLSFSHSRTHTHTYVYSSISPVSLLSAAIELNNFYDECELISVFLLLLVFFFAVLHLVFSYFLYVLLFHFILFSVLFLCASIYFRSHVIPCCDMPLFIRLSHFKRVFFISSLSFLFEFITCTAQHRKKNNDVYFIGCAFASLSFSF